ncbi:hypothetical protein [Sphingopyxis solisilvae]|uniref:hypothetical protein n=1 Tax=Sphingopyxis solisilvae TaxID=1886788 RepID=UPI001892A8DB|nr:hypothetical protein [Sphingopyxis solisilvae]
MNVEVEVKPADKQFVGWDVNVISWTKDLTRVIVHKIEWREESSGTFVGTTADLPAGIYGVRAQLVGPNREVEVTIRDCKVVQPAGETWPMTVKVNSPTQTQTSDTWYFEVPK